MYPSWAASLYEMKAGQSQSERLSDYPSLPKHNSSCFHIIIGQDCEVSQSCLKLATQLCWFSTVVHHSAFSCRLCMFHAIWWLQCTPSIDVFWYPRLVCTAGSILMFIEAELGFMGKLLLNSAKCAHLVDSCFVWHQLTCYWPSCCIGTQSNFMYA